MRKVLFIILIVLLVIFTGITIYKGTELGSLNIWGVTQIQEENEKIDQANAQLGTLVNSTYPQAVSKLNSSTETLQATKKEYEDQAVLVKNSKYYRETEKYKLEFLWTRIGNYAKDRKIDVEMSISTGSAAEFYNINVTARGSYVNVADFIYDIENDSRLGFKIEDFSMVSAGTTTTTNADGETITTSGGVVGKFACKEIQIDLKSLDNTNSIPNQDKTTTRTNAATNTNTATNTTNSDTPTQGELVDQYTNTDNTAGTNTAAQ